MKFQIAQSYFFKLTLIVLVSTIFSSRSQAGLHFKLGLSSIGYIETHQFQANLDTNISQMTPLFIIGAKKYFGGIIYTGIDSEYLGPGLVSSGKKTSFINGNAFLGLVIPAKPLNLAIEAEYFYYSMIPSDKTFGYKPLTGLSYILAFDFLTPKSTFLFHAKVPFWNGVQGLTRLEANIAYNFNRRKRSRWVLDLYYKTLTLSIPGTIKVDIKTTTIGTSLGFHW